jgi:glutathione S-transferase
LLAEKGISVTRVPVDLGAKEQFSEAYTRINARRVVPTLALADGTAIGEVPAIFRYLEDTHPHNSLFGNSPTDSALVTMWERRMEIEGFAAVMEAVRNAAAGLKGRAIAGTHDYEQIPALVERGRQRVTDFYADLEARLAEVSFVAGDRFSAADITAIVTVDFRHRGAELADTGRPRRIETLVRVGCCASEHDRVAQALPGNEERGINAVWTYETPFPAVEAIKGYLAFYPDRVEITEIT